MGMAKIKPGTPHKNPQNINIINTVTILIENDLPNMIGSTIDPKTTCTAVNKMMANSAVPGNCISIKVKIETATVETMEPTICTKLIAKANSPQKRGKLISKKMHTKLNPIPVHALTKNFTFRNLTTLFSIVMKVLMVRVCCLNIVS